MNICFSFRKTTLRFVSGFHDVILMMFNIEKFKNWLFIRLLGKGWENLNLTIVVLDQKVGSWTDFMLCTAIVTKCSNSSYFLSPLILAFYAIGNKNFFLCQLPKLVKFDNKAIYALHGNILHIHECDLFSFKGCKWHKSIRTACIMFWIPKKQAISTNNGFIFK